VLLLPLRLDKARCTHCCCCSQSCCCCCSSCR